MNTEVIYIIKVKDCPPDYAPIGYISTSMSNNIPRGWMSCHGQKLDKTMYAALYNAIKGAYGETQRDFCLPKLNKGKPPIDPKLLETELGKILYE